MNIIINQYKVVNYLTIPEGNIQSCHFVITRCVYFYLKFQLIRTPGMVTLAMHWDCLGQESKTGLKNLLLKKKEKWFLNKEIRSV